MAGKIEKATHQDATDFEGPVETGDAHGKRPADKKKVGDMNADTSVAKEDTGKVFDSGKVNEAEIKALFDGVEGLSEDFSAKAATLLEGAISEKISFIRESIEAEYETKLNEATENMFEDFSDKLDSYLNYVVENYMEENEIAIEQGIKNEISEQVLESMTAIVESYGIELPEDKLDIAESLAQELQETEKTLSDAISENIELKEKIEKFELNEALSELSSDLSAAGKEKLSRLAENISYGDIEDYKAKVGVLKESIISPTSETKQPVSPSEQLNEEVLINENTDDKYSKLSDRQKAYLRAARGE